MTFAIQFITFTLQESIGFFISAVAVTMRYSSMTDKQMFSLRAIDSR